MGIYTTVCDSEIKCKRNHKMFSRLINGCLGLQIVVAAALTALGAANGSRSAVTVFGAINTIIAGFLTYLKGSGLPGRLKFFQHEWTKVREYIEQRERDFMLDSHGLNPYEEVDKVRQMYEIVKADIESNRPDRFVSVSAMGKMPITQNPGPSLARPQPSFSTESFRKAWSEKEKEAGMTVNKAQGTAANLFSNVTHLKDVLEDKVKEIGHMEKEMETKGHQMVDEKKHGMFGQIQSAVKEVAHLGKEIEAKAKAAATEKEMEVEQGMSRAAEGVRSTAAQQRDGFNSAVAERRHNAEEAYNGARAGFAQQRDHLNSAAAERRQDVEDAYNRGTEAARAGVSQGRDNFNSAVSDRRHDAEDALNTARDGVAQQRDNFNSAVTDRRHDAEDAINRGADAARAEVAHQRDNADTALSHAQDEMARTSEAARAALQQQRNSLNAALVEGWGRV
ncbi:hypothetical protein M409DRAFT_15764 [Zasmidium cellare ATCC 36951]|uniref:SMODS and SLOG-associating 2TM effector domain-containing protein n=1 Tax=Zasmidium cellare ATCC 36951 TaxID=1080233 RepID=A0A6A6D2Z1_ZASCE|nr:uncharacterized protein M409DRAFT_15764 [Zasmidium cellare ATCC 36951]KAF2173483.1 hypothetical protein M409DRAFT_15764 [Zasmidium cellare ATCC 36951]